MSRNTASAMALCFILLTTAYVLYKPSDYEQLSELPTAQADVLKPPIADMIPKSAVVPNPLAPVIVSETVSNPETDIVKPTQQYPHTITVEATFYVATCEGCTGITKTGDNVRNTIYANGYRVIAVDTRVIPLRSIVEVTLANGTSFKAIASDVGGMIKGKRIDVLVASSKEAYALGRMSATIEILRKGDDDK